MQPIQGFLQSRLLDIFPQFLSSFFTPERKRTVHKMYIQILCNCQSLEITQVSLGGLVHTLQDIHPVETIKQQGTDYDGSNHLERFQSSNWVQASDRKKLYCYIPKVVLTEHFNIFFLDKNLCGPIWPPTHYRAENDMKLSCLCFCLSRVEVTGMTCDRCWWQRPGM